MKIDIYYPSLGQTLNDTALAVAQLVERSIVVDINFEWSLVRIQVARLRRYGRVVKVMDC